MTRRSAFLMLPGASITTVLLNLPCLVNYSTDTAPIILMDSHDYNRLRKECLRDKDDYQKAPYLLMAYDDLRRRGLIQPIDYAEFYSASLQDNYLQQNQSLIESTSEQINREVAVKGINSWIDYGRGDYQKAFRTGLGEDEDSFENLQQGEEKHRRKLKRGTGNPMGWNRKVLDRGVAALAVRDRVDQVLDLNVQGVAASTQYDILSDLLHRTESESIDADAHHLRHINPGRNIGLRPKIVSRTREVLDDVSEIAREITGVQHDDWFVLGPTLATPRYDDLFNFDLINLQLENEMDADTLAEETEKVIATLEEGGDDSLSPHKLRYEGEWIDEKYDVSSSRVGLKSSGLTDMVDCALNLSDYSRGLRSLIEQSEITQAAVFLGASIMIDPTRKSSNNDIYNHSINLISQLNPASLTKTQLEKVNTQRHSDTWKEYEDWFESINRER